LTSRYKEKVIEKKEEERKYCITHNMNIKTKERITLLINIKTHNHNKEQIWNDLTDQQFYYE